MGDVTVTVDDDHLGRIDEVADELRARGMRVDEVLAEIGIITGATSDDRKQALSSVAGVAAVEDQTAFQLPPPDADIQ